MRINLLPPEERPLKPSTIRWEFLVTLIGALGLVAVVVFAWLGSVRIQELNDSYEKGLAYEEVLYKKVQAVNELSGVIDELGELEKELYKLVEAENSINLLPGLVDHPYSHLWLERAVWSREKVNLVGYTKQATSLSRYLNFLNERAKSAVVTELNIIGATDFRTFKIEIRGVGSDGQFKLY